MKIKTRTSTRSLLTKLSSLSLSASFFLVTVIGLVAPLLIPGNARAARETYVLYYPDDEATKQALKDAYNKSGSDKFNNPAMENVSILSYGGTLFGNEPQRLVYDRAVNNQLNNKPNGGDADGSEQLFTKVYYCNQKTGDRTYSEPNDSQDPYYSVTYAVALTDMPDASKLFDVGTHRSTAVGATKILKITPAKAGLAGQPGTSKQTETLKELDDGAEANDLGEDIDKISQAKCRPTPVGENKIFVKNYYKDASSSDKSAVQSLLAAANTSGPGGTSGTVDEKQLDCTKDESPLTWVICPVIDTMAAAIDATDRLITNQMELDTEGIFGSSDGSCAEGQVCDAFFEAWKSFRNIALGLMVIAGLIILIAQALGVEILDIYTIKKTLPRLLVAAIGITLSWPLMRLAVEFTNDLGFGIRNMIYAPFSELGTTLDLNISGNGVVDFLLGGGAAVGGVATAGAAWWLTGGGIGVLFSYLATAGVAVLVAIVVLVLREIVIIMLMLFAPIAIIMYVLPNTSKFYKFWWESFSKALLMFPLIAAFIATGRIFSAISINSGGMLYQIIGFIAYFAPYFMIPLTLKFAGGFLRQIGGFADDRGRGVLGGIGKRRAEKRHKLGQERRKLAADKFHKGEFQNPIPNRFGRTNRAFGKVIGGTNEVGKRLGVGLLRGGYGFGAKGKTALEAVQQQALEHAAEERATKENADSNAHMRLMKLLAVHKGDKNAAEDAFIRWYTDDKNEYGVAFTNDEAQKKLVTANAKLTNQGGFTMGRAKAALINAGRDGTAIRDADDMAEWAAAVSEGSEDMTYRLLSQVSSDSAQKNRYDLKIAQAHKMAFAGAATQKFKGQIADADYQRIRDGAVMSGAGGTQGYTLMASAPSRVIRNNVEHAMDIIQRHVNDPSSVDFKEAAQAAALIEDMKANKAMGTTDNKIALDTALESDGRTTLLDDFYKRDVPAAEARPGADPILPAPKQVASGVPGPNGDPLLRSEKVADYVKRQAGDRYSGGQLTPEQINALPAAQQEAARKAAEDAQNQANMP